MQRILYVPSLVLTNFSKDSLTPHNKSVLYNNMKSCLCTLCEYYCSHNLIYDPVNSKLTYIRKIKYLQ